MRLTGKIVVEIATRHRTAQFLPDVRRRQNLRADPERSLAFGRGGRGKRRGRPWRALCHQARATTEGKIFRTRRWMDVAIGTPTAYNGRIYIQTTKKLYCFGDAKPASATFETADAAPEDKWPEAGPRQEFASQSRRKFCCNRRHGFVPCPGARRQRIDRQGNRRPKSVQWASFIPPTAKVKANDEGLVQCRRQLVAAPDKTPSAGAFQASVR